MKRNSNLFFFLLFLLAFSGCEETILHDLDELRANQVLVVLSRVGISAEKKREGALWNVEVNSSEISLALSTLEESRVLKRELSRFAEKSSGLMPSREERTYLAERQLAWNLEGTLEQLPEVLEARVHLYLENKDHFSLEPQKHSDSASVLLVYSGANPPMPEEIREIVSGASGVKKESVSVIFSAANSPTNDPKQETKPETSLALAKPQISDNLQGQEKNLPLKTSNHSFLFLLFIGSAMLCGILLFVINYKNRRQNLRPERAGLTVDDGEPALKILRPMPRNSRESHGDKSQAAGGGVF